MYMETCLAMPCSMEAEPASFLLQVQLQQTLLEAAKHLHDTIPNNWSNEEMILMEPDSVEGRFFVRVKDTSLDEVDKAFGKVEAVIEPDSLPEEFGFITRLMTQASTKRV